VPDTVQGDGFVLKIFDEGPLEVQVGFVLEIEVKSFDDDRAWGSLRCRIIVRDVDLRITATAEALQDVVAAVESALLEFQFRHSSIPGPHQNV